MKATSEETKARKHWINSKLIQMELAYIEMFGPSGQKLFLINLIMIASILLEELEEE